MSNHPNVRLEHEFISEAATMLVFKFLGDIEAVVDESCTNIDWAELAQTLLDAFNALNRLELSIVRAGRIRCLQYLSGMKEELISVRDDFPLLKTEFDRLWGEEVFKNIIADLEKGLN